MRYAPYLVLLTVFVVYAILVLVFGFTEYFALSIHFIRIGIVMAVLVMFIPSMRYMFTTVPYKSRDFLLAGIILAMLSNELFSIWNEMHRVFGVDNNVFTSPISGFFSLLVALGGLMFLRASDMIERRRWIVSLVIAVLFSILLVFVAPTFR